MFYKNRIQKLEEDVEVLQISLITLISALTKDEGKRRGRPKGSKNKKHAKATKGTSK